MEELDYSDFQPYVQKDIQDGISKYLAEKQYGLSRIPFHIHNGVDTDHVSYKDLINRKTYISATLPGTTAATAANYGVVWIATFACNLTAVRASYETASTSGTLQIEKLTGTTAPGSGTTMLSTTINLATTANTVYSGTLTETISSLQVAVGDRIALKDGGTLTNQVGLCVILELTY